MTEEAASEGKPSEQLAARISRRLVKEGLIAADRQAKIAGALASGAVSQADWRVEVERAIDRKAGPEDAMQNQQG